MTRSWRRGWGVSRTPVREALLRIGEAGLVVARPGRSTVVSEVEADAVRDARDVVAAMHQLAVRESARPDRCCRHSTGCARPTTGSAPPSRGDLEAAISADDEACTPYPCAACGNRAGDVLIPRPVTRRSSVRRAEPTSVRSRPGPGATPRSRHDAQQVIRL